MHDDEHAAGNVEHRADLAGRWGLRGAVALLLVAAAATIWFTVASPWAKIASMICRSRRLSSVGSDMR